MALSSTILSVHIPACVWPHVLHQAHDTVANTRPHRLSALLVMATHWPWTLKRPPVLAEARGSILPNSSPQHPHAISQLLCMSTTPGHAANDSCVTHCTGCWPPSQPVLPARRPATARYFSPGRSMVTADTAIPAAAYGCQQTQAGPTRTAGNSWCQQMHQAAQTQGAQMWQSCSQLPCSHEHAYLMLIIRVPAASRCCITASGAAQAAAVIAATPATGPATG